MRLAMVEAAPEGTDAAFKSTQCSARPAAAQLTKEEGHGPARTMAWKNALEVLVPETTVKDGCGSMDFHFNLQI